MTPQEIAKEAANSEIDPVVYDQETVYDHCVVRVIWNPFDPDNAIIDWNLEGGSYTCPYPLERIMAFHKNVQVIVLEDSKTGKVETMWKRYPSQESDTDRETVTIQTNIYDQEEWYEHQEVNIYCPVSGKGEVKIGYHPVGAEHYDFLCGYEKVETVKDVRVQVLYNSITGESSVGWERYPS